ncbi:hypothetical protein P154DRAFT_451449 [Amniculicola lignicola CBS 123094]|uniref:UbiA prenyltransferase n=1 Tax=Amniculicola lignicola CBS 123094 TaxID=1392246 RepID=A0A6A5VWD4_9PLEO|nr:hypothetical protein P154DRAFT_451449 [Amniculicola lignicola CBS 123094]
MEFSRLAKSSLYQAYTVWLFTRSDIKTIIAPSTFFAAVCSLSDSGFHKDGAAPTMLVLKRLPATTFWVWMNLLPFAIENQRQSRSIMEDAHNKPWRPLPSNRLTKNQAMVLMILFYLLAIGSSHFVGGLTQCLALIVLGYWYNDLGGADRSCVIRNLINGFGYICFTSGALEVLTDRSIIAMELGICCWIVIVGLVISTTVQAQDMPDQLGDNLRGRWTVPLVIGDRAARYTIAVAVAAWSYICPKYWNIDSHGCTATFTLGVVVSVRYLFTRTMEADRITFRVYNMWIVSLYLLPLMRPHGGVSH